MAHGRLAAHRSSFSHKFSAAQFIHIMSRRGGIFTFRDIDENGGAFSASSSDSGANTNTPAASLENITSQNGYKDCPPMTIRHIPHLPQANEALSMLRRIHSEFYPIIQRRGYRVLLLAEMCCCGDGNDYEPNGNRSNKRKKRSFHNNVLGYNASRGGVSEIRIRLRHGDNHNRFFSYEEIAGTMSHELAHCRHGAHSAQFYKLMDEIQEQHAVFQVKGIVADNGGFPLNSRQAHVLGSSNASNKKKNGPLEAALARQRQAKSIPPPQRLGGKKTRMPPRRAAAMAAEARRLRDEQWCQPCQDYSDDDDDVEVLAGDDKKRKQPSNKQNSKRQTEVILLDDDNDDEETPERETKPSAVECIDLTESENASPSSKPFASKATSTASSAAPDSVSNDDMTWSCPTCTLVNNFPVLVCCACQSTLQNNDNATHDLVQEMHLKENEVQQSREDFGGFNIYKSSKRTSSTMDHLT